MPKPVTKASAKRRTAKTSATKRNFRRTLIFVIAASVGCLTLAFIGSQIFKPSSMVEPQQVLSQIKSQPVSLNANFEDQVRNCLFPIAKVHGYNLDIASGFRSSADQDILYAQGRTTPGDVVTNAQGGQSLHNFGLAVDVVDDTYSYDIDWQRLGRIGAYCGLEHGDRGHEDLPHFQYRGGLSLEQINDGQQPAQLRLPCEILAQRAAAKQILTRQDLHQCRAPSFNQPS